MVYEYTRPRRPIAAMFATPGPIYSLPTLTGYKGHDISSSHSRSPAYGMGARTECNDSGTPGPKYLVPPGITRTGKCDAPSYSFQDRQKEPKKYVTPSPGQYSPDISGTDQYSQAPSFSIGTKIEQRYCDPNVPPPTAYTLPNVMGRTVQSDKRQAPSATLKGRNEVGSFNEDLRKTPGPARYGAVEPGVFLKRSPSYSMLSRGQSTAVIIPKEITPGPGEYSTDKLRSRSANGPRYSFGIRHSPFIHPMVVEPVAF